MTRNGVRILLARAGFLKARWGMLLGGLGVLAACAVVRYYWGTASAEAQAPQENVAEAAPLRGESAPDSSTPSGKSSPAAGPSATSARKPIPEIVASVNGRPITREELAQDCLVHHGKDILESMVNKFFILQECRRVGISVTRKEVDDEIERMAKRFGIPVDQWLKMLKQERGIRPEQYADDIIWPTLALRKLAGERLIITEEERIRAFETEYGPAVRARLIACRSADSAEKVRALAAANPDDFGNLAKTYSEDPASASVKGLIQPVRKHTGCREIEEAAFSMADGEVSKVIATKGQYVILKREGLIEARKIRLDQVAPALEEFIRDRKLRTVAAEIFEQLQKRSAVENVFNDPVKSRQMPGVAALINGSQITLRQLAEECIERHGALVRDGLINRKLIELACKQQNVAVNEKEMESEIARAASLMVKPLADGSPDVKTWLEMVAKRQGITADAYRRDVVWPSVALRKLTGDKVQVTDEDLKRGFEANYGPRVRCRAIVMSQFRRAQQVWDMARKKPTVENFGELASKYSIEAGSRSLQGEVPPIRKYGGQPELEKEAFALKPGEISGLIQLDNDKYIILFCEGYTKPTEVRFAEVRDLIYEDIRDKKLRLAMADCFERLQDSATVDNYLAGTSRSPAKTASGSRDGGEVGAVAPAAYRAPVER